MRRSDALLTLATLTLLGCESNKKEPEIANDTPGALIVAYRPDSADTFVARGMDSVLALDWLRHEAAAQDIGVWTKSYPFGILVEQIGPRKNGEGGFWLYKVNGQMVPKSSDAHLVAGSDTVTFFFDER